MRTGAALDGVGGEPVRRGLAIGGVIGRLLDIEGREEIVESTREVILSRHERMVQAVVQDPPPAS
jgi:hypothetical protein